MAHLSDGDESSVLGLMRPLMASGFPGGAEGYVSLFPSLRPLSRCVLRRTATSRRTAASYALGATALPAESQHLLCFLGADRLLGNV